MLLLVGLGNPGPKYENNRHNIGFMAVDEIVRRHSFGPWKTRFQAFVSEGKLGGQKVLVLKPRTFMNESGRSVGEACRFYKLGAADMVVIHDELDIVAARLKVKQGGGNGGHNGLRSLDACLADKNYYRVRIGIGHPGDKNKVSGYVLGDFLPAEKPAMEKLINAVAANIAFLIEEGAPVFQNKVMQELKPRRNHKPPSARHEDKNEKPVLTKSATEKKQVSSGKMAEAFAKAGLRDKS